MRINDLEKLGELRTVIDRLQRESTTATKSVEGSSSVGDRVEVSRTSVDFLKIKEIIDESPEIRDALVSRVREELDQGSYQVDSEELARLILDDPLKF